MRWGGASGPVEEKCLKKKKKKKMKSTLVFVLGEKEIQRDKKVCGWYSMFTKTPLVHLKG